MKYTKSQKHDMHSVNLVVFACLLSTGHIFAQNNSNSENKISQEREQTKSMIENVTADQKGSLDLANTLGQRLNKNINKNNKGISIKNSNDNIENTAADSSMSPIVLGQWPVLLPPSDKKLLVNPRPRGIRNDDGTLVYTPDFSRQRLTMGLLNNNPFIDLPNQEIENVNYAEKKSKSKINIEKSLTLADLVYAGINYSPILDQAQSQLEIAIARSKSARAELLPKASARYSKGKENSQAEGSALNNHDTTSSAYRIGQPLINLPATQDWMSELNNQDAATWRLHSAKEAVALSVINAVINLATSRMVLDFADEQLIEFNRLLEYIQSRNQTGAASVADMERTRTRVLQTQQLRIEQQASYRNSLLEIERLTGLTPDSIQLPYLNQLPGLPNTQADIRRIVWANSYDLRTLRKEIKAQELAVSSQYSKYLPTLSLSLERDDGKNIRGVNPRQVDNRALAVVNWEMSLGGKELYAAKAVQSELINRQARLNEESEKTLQGVDADFALLQSATLRISTGQSEQQAAEIVLISVREQIKNGRVGSLLEALDANERYFNARQRLVQTLGQQIQAQAQLLKRIGVLSQVAEQAGIKFETKASMGVSPEPVILIKPVELDTTPKKDKLKTGVNLINEKPVDLRESTSTNTNSQGETSVIRINEVNIEGVSLPKIETETINLNKQ